MISEWGISALTAFYGVTSIISMIAYAPTVQELWKGIPSASVRTWVLWLISTTGTLLYAIFVAKDTPFALVSGGHLFFASLILFLRLRLPEPIQT